MSEHRVLDSSCYVLLTDDVVVDRKPDPPDRPIDQADCLRQMRAVCGVGALVVVKWS